MIPSCSKMKSLRLLSDAAKDFCLLVILSEDKTDRDEFCFFSSLLKEPEHCPPLVRTKFNKNKNSFFTTWLDLKCRFADFLSAAFQNKTLNLANNNRGNSHKVQACKQATG